MPRTITVYTAQEVADALSEDGWLVSVDQEWSWPEEEDTDGTVEIHPGRFHVQVGFGYLILNEWEDAETLRHGHPRTHPHEIVADLQEASGRSS